MAKPFYIRSINPKTVCYENQIIYPFEDEIFPFHSDFITAASGIGWGTNLCFHLLKRPLP
jgi:hypothetical protein